MILLSAYSISYIARGRSEARLVKLDDELHVGPGVTVTNSRVLSLGADDELLVIDRTGIDYRDGLEGLKPYSANDEVRALGLGEYNVSSITLISGCVIGFWVSKLNIYSWRHEPEVLRNSEFCLCCMLEFMQACPVATSKP
jgi:hypothetical protein